LSTDDENLTPRRKDRQGQGDVVRVAIPVHQSSAARNIRLWAFFFAAFHLICANL
jgi:hypothetical protein